MGWGLHPRSRVGGLEGWKVGGLEGWRVGVGGLEGWRAGWKVGGQEDWKALCLRAWHQLLNIRI